MRVPFLFDQLACVLQNGQTMIIFYVLKGDADHEHHLLFTLPFEAFILPTLNIFEISG
jgi:hypothetical protein